MNPGEKERIALWERQKKAKKEPEQVRQIREIRTEEPEVIQWPEPPEPAAYHGLAGDIVRAIEPHTEADPVALLIQLLTVFTSVCGRRAHFTAEADNHYLNLFAVLVGRTSKARKGSSWGQIKALGKSVDEDWGKQCIQSGLSSGEGLIWAIRDPIEKTEPIREKKQITGYQSVIVDQGIEDKRILVVEPEYASVLKQSSREANILSAVLRQAWDDGNLKSMTKNSPARATNAHINLIGHITKDELMRSLESTEAANGFANRHLWLCVRRSKSLPEGGKLTEVDFNELLRRLKQAVEVARATGEMRRDAGARDYWLSIYDDLSEGKPGLLGAATSRAEAQVMRLACLYALLECSQVVCKRHLEASHALWVYAENSARFIFGEAMGDPLADSILVGLKEAGSEGLTRTQISHLLGKNSNAGAIARGLSALAEAGRARSEKRKEEHAPKPIEYWFANSLSSITKLTNLTNLPSTEEQGNGVSSLNSLISYPVFEIPEVCPHCREIPCECPPLEF